MPELISSTANTGPGAVMEGLWGLDAHKTYFFVLCQNIAIMDIYV